MISEHIQLDTDSGLVKKQQKYKLKIKLKEFGFCDYFTSPDWNMNLFYLLRDKPKLMFKVKINYFQRQKDGIRNAIKYPFI